MNTLAANLREEGKELLFQEDCDPDTRILGIKKLLDASNMGDPEAACILGEQFLSGRFRINDQDPHESGFRFLYRAETLGSYIAKKLLDRICANRYKVNFCYDPSAPHPLTGFDGKPIEINRTGRRVPVDAVLSFDGAVNSLTLSVNISFLDADDSEEFNRYASAVLDGIKDWGGDYYVFGGQPLTVIMNVSTVARLSDSIFVQRFDAEFERTFRKMSSKISKLTTEAHRNRVKDAIDNHRSFAMQGIRRWSVHSKKIIYMMSEDGTFADQYELRAVARHEFGHVLGLGDLYASESDGFEGVEPGTYPELDDYHMFEKNYHSVMCDHHAEVSNNDIEMVILAFSTNKYQAFQKDKIGKISEALGKGN